MTMNENDKQAEPVYAYRRRGLDEFCTCDESRYTEVSAKPSLFEVAVFYRHPAQPVQPDGAQGEADGWFFEFNNHGATDFVTDRRIAEDIKRHLEPDETCTEYFKQAPAASINEQLLQALKLVLPLAKGYAAKNDVGGNQEYCVIAEAAIAEAEKAKGGV